MLFEPEMLEAIEPDGPPGLLRIAEEVIKKELGSRTQHFHTLTVR